MDRRQFLYLTAAGAAAAHQFAPLAFGETSIGRRSIPKLVSVALTSPATGFPTVTPNFAAMFSPGTATQMTVFSETFTDFNNQVQTLAASNYRLACFTSIQSMNRTWFYGVLQPGSANYILMRTSDPNAFQQAFTQHQGSYNLVDFNVAWELGTIYYTGYWLAASPAKAQTLLSNLSFADLGTQWTALSGKGQRMTRIQAFPNQDAPSFYALFEPGTDTYVLYAEAISAFANDLANRFTTASLVGIGYDPVGGNLAGCWRAKVSPSQFVYNVDWPTLVTTIQQNAAKGMVLTAITAYPNAPSFDDYFATNLAPYTMGYAYAVAKDGQIIGSGGGYARSPLENQNAGVPFTADTRLNLASVSKAITGITLEAFLQQYPSITLDSPFWPLIQAKVPNPDPSVKVVTLRNLVTMMSGMVQEANEGPISPPNGDFWGYLVSYLAQPLVGTPGKTYYYDNTNFSILQGVIEQVSGMAYVDFATKYVLTPAGLNPSILNATPDPQASAALTYSGPADTRAGYYWTPIGFVAPAGWISSARELVKLVAALRGTSILPASVVSEMFADGIGWDTNTGNFGTYYQHNGSIGNGLTPAQRLNTCVFHFAEGYDLALISDSLPPVDVTSIAQGAFDARGLPYSAQPANAPSLTSAVHAASYLPKVAPGTYVSIIGSGFTTQSTDWSGSFSGNSLPIEVSGIQVRVNSQFAYVEYISPTQVNFLMPANAAVGMANVELTTPSGGMTTTLEIDAVAPGLFAYTLNGTLYPAALFAGTATYVLTAGAIPGITSRAAKAGDIIELFGSGMGPTSPAAPDGVIFTTAYPAANLAGFAATIGGVKATVQFAGLVSPGLYQVNVVIPAGLTGGDQALMLTVNGVAIQPNLKVSIQA